MIDFIVGSFFLSFYFFLLQCENNIIKYCFPLVYSASLIVGLTIWRVFAGFFLGECNTPSVSMVKLKMTHLEWYETWYEIERARLGMCTWVLFLHSIFFRVFFSSFKCMILVVYIFVNDNSQVILSLPNIILLTCEVLISQLRWAHTLGVHFCLPFDLRWKSNKYKNISTSNKNCLLLNTLS